MPVDAGDIAHEALRIWLESARRGGLSSSVIYRRTIDAMRSLLGDQRRACNQWTRAPFHDLITCDTPERWVQAFEAVRDHGKLPDPVPSYSTGTVGDRLLRWIAQRGNSGASHAVIAAECGLARETVTRALAQLVASGRVNVGSGRCSRGLRVAA